MFQHDHNKNVDRREIEQFVADRLHEGALQQFCLGLYDGFLSQASDIDERLALAAENWRLPRMAGVDRNILRLGAYELLHAAETPPAVVLDEAIQLWERGEELYKTCVGKLDAAQGKIEELARRAESARP